MKTLYLDTFAGISGDMFLGLLVDLGLPAADLEKDLQLLPVPGWRLESRRERRLGIEGTRIEVLCEEQHHHRTWADIDRLLADSALPPTPKDLARRIFRRLGVAEAKVHGVALEKVHFHEVGAVDSIVDIAGAAIGLHRLGIGKVVCAPLPLSRGMVRTAHGQFPLPAPATAELLQGLPVVEAGSDKELVTPTGAAIVAEIAEFAALPAMTLLATGYGVGGWQLTDRPNLLRGLLGETATDGCQERDVVTVLESNIDDSSPEWLGCLLERLLAAGALDAGFAPQQMKKNRPGVRITVVAEPPRAEELARLILRESSAIGVRYSTCQRFKLRREAATVTTEIGEAQVKCLYEGAELLRITPEFDSCRVLAEASGKPLPEVVRLVERAASEKFFPLQRVCAG